ncbi:helix-turn-helix domain-containing protein [Kitasatospora sp. NPDC058046]|uniref:helix-turn-helix domain-containing protein n=1 Tax=Kitasatospora sp. NPDC058046 TaxID=3346312 RepID=UPI0036DF63BC
MTTWVTATCALESCGRAFQRPVRAGRPKQYHTTKCQKRAQRLRDKGRAAVRRTAQDAGGWGQLVAEDVHAAAGRLLDAQSRQAPLVVLVARARELRGEVDHYAAAVVHDAHRGGASWSEIGAALGVEADSARRRWAPQQVEQQLVRRRGRQAAAEPGGSGPVSGEVAVRAPGPRYADHLAAALTVLQVGSEVSLQAAAEQAGCSASYVSRILAGDRVPTWPILQTLVEAFGGDPRSVRMLWELAQGIVLPGRVSLAVAADRMLWALRGLHLAAGELPVERVCARAPGLTEKLVRSVLEFETVPDWPVVSALATALGGRPADLRPCWEQLHYAVLVELVHGGFGRAGGFERAAVPEGEASHGWE